jgi:hypothetical protein
MVNSEHRPTGIPLGCQDRPVLFVKFPSYKKWPTVISACNRKINSIACPSNFTSHNGRPFQRQHGKTTQTNERDGQPIANQVLSEKSRVNIGNQHQK